MEPAATRNQITLRGSLLALPQLSHENHDKEFFRFLLEVPRLSGAVDILPVIAERSVLDTLDLSGGDMLTVSGQVRSHNLRENGKRHLSIFVFASQICAEEGEPVNRCLLDGIVCREPTYRRTPPGAGNMRRDAGRTTGIPSGGLSALHSLGQDCRPGRKLQGRRPNSLRRAAAKPHLHQAHRKRRGGADGL